MDSIYILFYPLKRLLGVFLYWGACVKHLALQDDKILPPAHSSLEARLAFAALARELGNLVSRTRYYVSHAHPPTHLAPQNWNEEMAAPALTAQEAQIWLLRCGIRRSGLPRWLLLLSFVFSSYTVDDIHLEFVA